VLFFTYVEKSFFMFKFTRFCNGKEASRMTKEEKMAWAIKQLQDKYDELGMLPAKSDFDAVTLSRIKAFLGPWPRALESAGLKEKKETPKKTAHKRKTRL